MMEVYALQDKPYVFTSVLSPIHIHNQCNSVYRAYYVHDVHSAIQETFYVRH